MPAYTMAPDAQHVSLLRVVIREDFSCSLAQRLVHDLERVLEYLDARPPKVVDAMMEKVNNSEATMEPSVHADPYFNCKKAINVWKKYALHKTNGVC